MLAVRRDIKRRLQTFSPCFQQENLSGRYSVITFRFLSMPPAVSYNFILGQHCNGRQNKRWIVQRSLRRGQTSRRKSEGEAAWAGLLTAQLPRQKNNFCEYFCDFIQDLFYGMPPCPWWRALWAVIATLPSQTSAQVKTVIVPACWRGAINSPSLKTAGIPPLHMRLTPGFINYIHFSFRSTLMTCKYTSPFWGDLHL